MRSQLDALGYDGEILSPALLKTFDARSAQMRLIAEQINDLAVPGDVAELGVFRGDFAVQINAAFSDRTIHLFDTFEGFCAADVDIERQNGYSAARVGDFSETAKDIVDKKLLYRERAVFHKGFFPATFRGCEKTALCLRLDRCRSLCADGPRLCRLFWGAAFAGRSADDT